MGERTGSGVLCELWSYVLCQDLIRHYNATAAKHHLCIDTQPLRYVAANPWSFTQLCLANWRFVERVTITAIVMLFRALVWLLQLYFEIIFQNVTDLSLITLFKLVK
jgi:hypothetical protein